MSQYNLDCRDTRLLSLQVHWSSLFRKTFRKISVGLRFVCPKIQLLCYAFHIKSTETLKQEHWALRNHIISKAPLNFGLFAKLQRGCLFSAKMMCSHCKLRWRWDRCSMHAFAFWYSWFDCSTVLWINCLIHKRFNRPTMANAHFKSSQPVLGSRSSCLVDVYIRGPSCRYSSAQKTVQPLISVGPKGLTDLQCMRAFKFMHIMHWKADQSVYFSPGLHFFMDCKNGPPQSLVNITGWIFPINNWISELWFISMPVWNIALYVSKTSVQGRVLSISELIVSKVIVYSEKSGMWGLNNHGHFKCFW